MAVLIIILIIAVPILLVVLYTNYDLKTHEKEMFERRQRFKQQAHKIPVNLADCKVKKHRVHYQKKQRCIQSERFDAVDSRVFGLHRNDTKEMHSCTISYKTEINGKPVTFTTDVGKHEMTVYALFDRQKTTYIYVDKQDIENYYFDLEFLD